MRHQIKTYYFPELACWVASTYGIAAHLVFGDVTILSSCGFHQGDPLGVLLFSLVLQPLVLLLQYRIPT